MDSDVQKWDYGYGLPNLGEVAGLSWTQYVQRKEAVAERWMEAYEALVESAHGFALYEECIEPVVGVKVGRTYSPSDELVDLVRGAAL